MKLGLKTLGAVAGVALASLMTAASAASITGAGATFPAPIYQKWAAVYKGVSGNTINYNSIGSGGGIQQAKAGTVTFGASDKPLKGPDLAASDLAQFPTVIGGDVPVVNISGVAAGQLVLDGPTLAKIFLGQIGNWSDPAIKALNPAVNLPNQAIAVVHRSDGSGTTYIWVDYLSKISPEFKKRVGVATSVNWPTGVGGKGNEGVAGLVKQTPGAIGYVELIYALQSKLGFGSVQNMAGEFVRSSLASVTAAAAGAANAMPKDFRVSITNAPGTGVYPISSFTWMLFYENPKDRERAKIMVDFFKWALTDGQRYSADLGYAPLPKEVVALEMDALKKIKF